MNNDAGSTRTEEIFKTNCPWAHRSQGPRLRVLFVCSAGLLRSPTAAAWGTQEMDWNTRSCGSHDEYALIPLSLNLILWAERIVFVNPENHTRAMKRYKDLQADVADVNDDNYGRPLRKNITEIINDKAVILNIPDVYNYGDEWLCRLLDREADRIAIPANYPATV